MDSEPENSTDEEVIARLRSELAKSEPSRRNRIIENFFLPHWEASHGLVDF